MYRKQKKSNDPEHEVIYKRFRNKLNSIIAKAERDHYSKLFEEHKGNLKKSWNVLREVINKRKSESSCSRFIINENITTDKVQIANGFNSFFVNVGPSLANKIRFPRIAAFQLILCATKLLIVWQSKAPLKF